MRKTWVGVVGVLLFIVAVNVGLSYLLGFKMHHALGFLSVYRKNVFIHLIAVYGSAAVIAILSVLSVRNCRNLPGRGTYAAVRAAAAVIGWLVGFTLGHIDPTQWLLFFHHALFQKSDPIFHLDYSFYVYTLPILESILVKLSTLLFYFAVVKALTAMILYAANDTSGAKTIVYSVRTLARLASCYTLLLAVTHFLGRYSAMYTASEGNFLFGPGFRDTHFAIPVSITLESLLLLALAVYFFVFSFKIQRLEQIMRFQTYKPAVTAIASTVGVFILLAVTGSLINAFYVHPNQESAETPYIARTIAATRWALGIQNVQTKSFDPSEDITSKTIKNNQNLLSNIRINDIGQTKDIYNQLQSFKSYFEFQNAEPDRYKGKEVYIDTRQMNIAKLPVKTWINQNLVYTHGYGVTASPVNEFTSDGLPVTIAQDTPQTTKPPLPAIKQPEIYFGTMNNEVIAPSKAAEFDYPVNSSAHTSHYKGGYALPLMGNRLLLAFEDMNLKYLTSNQLTNRSQLLFDRNIYGRVRDIAPFLHYGNDAYPFITDSGQIDWMLDGYTTTDRIPYAQSFGGVNYERNSFKVVMNAYTGKVTFYVADPTDPMMKSLMSLYPGLFTTKIPDDVQAHFRYPKNLFELQARAIQTYHMTNPSSFYNQEDLWQLAQEIYNQNQTSARPAVYQMIQLPDQDKPSFVLSQLFTPSNKLNLNGWLVAGNDGNAYGKLTLYQFTQKQLVFGPMQAENQIDSDPSVSQQLTLWNQQGSHVVRGNLLLVPIGPSLLYVEPIYLVANRSGSLPQLQRVVVNYNKKVYMGDTLADALKMMVGGIAAGQQGGQAGAGKPSPSGTPASIQDLAKQANQWLDDYKKQSAAGNFDKAGQDLKKVESIIQQMTKK